MCIIKDKVVEINESTKLLQNISLNNMRIGFNINAHMDFESWILRSFEIFLESTDEYAMTRKE